MKNFPLSYSHYMNKTSPNNKPFAPPGFIVGVGRSGTTLVASILNRHPDICVTPETHFFRYVNGFPGGERAIANRWPESGVQLLQNIRSTRTWKPNSEGIINKLGPHYPGLKKFFEALGENIAETQNKRYWIEKTPHHLMDIELIRTLFPASPIIYVIRDGRDVAISMAKSAITIQESESLIANIFTWVKKNQYGRKFLSTSKNMYVIRYEDLLFNPLKEIGSLCEFLGVDFLSSMLMPDGNENSLIERDFNHKEMIKNPLDTGKAYGWKRTLSDEMSNAALIIAGEELSFWGYESQCTKEKKHDRCIGLIESEHLKQWPSALDELICAITGKLLCQIKSVNTDFSSNSKFPCEIAAIGDVVPVDINGKGIRLIINMAIIFFRLHLKILNLKRFHVRYLWIYHGDASKTKRWRFRQFLEKTTAKHAHLIICPCGGKKCPIMHTLNIDAKHIAHTKLKDFNESVIQSINTPG